jgi:hypothetical protein
MICRSISAALIAAVVATSGWAGQPEPVALAAVKHAAASLEVIGTDGASKTYSPNDLETFPTYRLKTTTPWRQEAAEFEGVLLTDILAAHGLSDVPAIKVTAENDFTSVIGREVWQSVQILVATRVDGRPHSRRARGPIQFVMDMDAYSASDAASESDLVWMAARIEPEL